jgi:formate dehydrogenase subunit delta
MAPKQIDHLIKMANQIALNTGAHTDVADSARRTGEHLRKFWTPAMREQLGEYCASGGEGLEPVVEQVLREMSP